MIVNWVQYHVGMLEPCSEDSGRNGYWKMTQEKGPEDMRDLHHQLPCQPLRENIPRVDTKVTQMWDGDTEAHPGETRREDLEQESLQTRHQWGGRKDHCCVRLWGAQNNSMPKNVYNCNVTKHKSRFKSYNIIKANYSKVSLSNYMWRRQ